MDPIRIDLHIHARDERSAEDVRHALRMLGTIMEKLENIMPAIDDLKRAIGGLIQEGTSDIAALVERINTQSNNDPAIVALTRQVTDATSAMHTAFTGVTGVPLQPATPPHAS